MKKIAGLLVILVIVLLGAYYSMGYLTERNVKRTIANLNEVNGLFADIEQYDRGWFTADAMINWNFRVPERVVKTNGQSKTVPAKDYSVQMPLKIYHGPIIFSDTGLHFGLGYAHTDLKLPQNYAKQFDEMFTASSERPKLSLSLFVNYLNKTDVAVGVPSFKLIAKKGDGEFEWLGMSSTTSVSSNLNTVDGEFKIEGFRLSKDKTKIKMGNFSTTYDLYRSSRGLMLGEANLDFPIFTITNDKAKLFEVAGVTLNSKSDVDDDLFNAHLKASLDKVYATGQTYGPGRVEMFLRNLDAEVLAKINAQTAAAQHGTEAEQRQALLSTLPLLPKLFSKGAEFEISALKFTMPQGTIEGHLLLSVPKGEDVNPLAMIQKVTGNGKLSIPEDVLRTFMRESVKQKLLQKPDIQQALVQQMQKNNQASSDENDAAATQTDSSNPPNFDQMVEARVNQNLAVLTQVGALVKQDSYYVIEFKLENGKLTINDKPFNPAMLNF
ncbi:DUF945 domain-containing protein [Legionella israelensis]|uniref:DUF945 domain-containing protein n=1 Tax=Legionella israelensis TaxID=454 RepID=A0AAX1EIV7_9GAMM|nr:YdgA family protein [Legionella israelensis]QBR84979.1 DUF945 domain-containing protein [Legionella israelensis]QDP73507.1 DUF945 domain-containing protein [Legionella israelensis]